MRGLDDDDGPARSTRVVNPYAQLIAIFRGMMHSASALSAVPFEIVDRRTDEVVLPTAAGYGGDLVRFFQQPNPAMEWEKFVETVVIHHYSGQAYMLPLGRSAITRIPSRIKILNPQRVRPQRHAGDDPDDLETWLYRFPGAGGEIEIPVERLMRLEYAPNPLDAYQGMSPFVPGRLDLEAENSAAVYQRSMMQNGGAPGAILTYQGEDEEMPREDANKLEEEWARKFAAASNNAKIAILTSKWVYQVLGFRPKDMEYMAQRGFNLKQFSRLLNIPPLFFGEWESAGLTDSGIRNQKQLLYEMNTIPLAKKFVRLINRFIVQVVDPMLEAQFNFESVEALAESLDERATAAKRFLEMGFTLEQVNDRFDLQFDTSGMSWAKHSLVAASLTTAEKIVSDAENPPEPPPAPPGIGQQPLLNGPTPDAAAPAAAPEGLPPAAEGLPQRALQVASPDVEARAPKRPSAARILRAKNAFLAAHRRSENDLTEGIRNAIMGYRSAVLSAVSKRSGGGREQRAAGDDEKLDLSAVDVAEIMKLIDDKRLLRVLDPRLRKAYRAGTATTQDLLAAVGVPAPDLADYQSERLPQIVDGYIDRRLGTGLPTTVTDDTRREVNSVILEALNQGQTLRDTVVGIRDVFNASLSRARTIARTETQIAMNGARFTAFEAQGVEQHQWLTAGDEHVRDEHEMINGTIATVGEEFLPGLKFPGDPDCDDLSLIINCRCTTVPLSRRMAQERLEGGAPVPSDFEMTADEGD